MHFSHMVLSRLRGAALGVATAGLALGTVLGPAGPAQAALTSVGATKHLPDRPRPLVSVWQKQSRTFRAPCARLPLRTGTGGWGRTRCRMRGRSAGSCGGTGVPETWPRRISSPSTTTRRPTAGSIRRRTGISCAQTARRSSGVRRLPWGGSWIGSAVSTGLPQSGRYSVRRACHPAVQSGRHARRGLQLPPLSGGEVVRGVCGADRAWFEQRGDGWQYQLTGAYVPGRRLC